MYKSLEYLLSMPTIPKSETAKQVKSFTKSKDKIFTFLLDGAQNYATLRSIIDTSRKRGLDEFESLVSIIQGNSLF